MRECDAIQDWLLAEEDELAPEARQRLAAHLADCPDCAREARLLQEVMARARALPVPAPPASFWADFGEGVRRRIAAVPPPRPSPWTSALLWLRGLWGPWRVPALAAAAALGLLLAFGLVRSHRVLRESPPADALALAEDLGIGQNLDVLENFDLLENLDVLERLHLLQRLDARPHDRLS